MKISSKENGKILSTPQRRFKHYRKTVISALRPLKQDYHEALRPKWLRTHLESSSHANLICGVLCFNLVLLMMTHKDMEGWLSWVCNAGNTFVTVVFICDFAAFLVAYGFRKYFSDSHLRFDFFVTATSTIDTCLEISAGFDGRDCPTLSMLRALRVLRLVRLLHHFPGVQVFIASVFSALPSIYDLVGLLLIFIIIMASIGNAIFQEQYEDAIEAGVYTRAWKRHSNFGKVISSMVELTVLATGDQWEGEMFEMKVASEASGGSDDNWQVLLFHCIFQVLGQCLFLNLFIMVVVEAYEVLDDDKRSLADAAVKDFIDAWSKLDPNGTGVIAPKFLPTLLLLMQPPIGLQGNTSRLVLSSHTHVLEIRAGFKYEFASILEELLLLYVYTDEEADMRIERSRRALARECCRTAFQRALHRARLARALAMAPPPSVVDRVLQAVGLQSVAIVEDPEYDDGSDVDADSFVSIESETFSDFSDIITCNLRDGQTYREDP